MCAGRGGGHRVAMAHPDDLLPREVVEERRRRVELDLGLPVLGDVVRLDSPAQLPRHQLHPVADAERRNPELEDRGVGERRAVRVDGGGPAGEDERDRVPSPDLFCAEPVRDELRVDTRLADASRDQLAVLAAEVEDEDGALRPARLRAGERKNLGWLSHADSSALPS